MPESSLSDYEWPTCTACRRKLREDELGRVACRICQDRAGENLAALPGPPAYDGKGRDRKLVSGLYSALAEALTPGAGSGEGRVSGSRTAPLPLRLEPLSLSARGGVVTILQTWQVDWHDTLGWRHPRWEGDLQQQLDQVVKALWNNLDWAASSHPAFDEFAIEVASIVRSCRRQVTGERPERRIPVACSCGATLHVTISTPGARCGGCGIQYGREEALELPLAVRAAA